MWDTCPKATLGGSVTICSCKHPWTDSRTTCSSRNTAALLVGSCAQVMCLPMESEYSVFGMRRIGTCRYGHNDQRISTCLAIPAARAPIVLGRHGSCALCSGVTFHSTIALAPTVTKVFAGSHLRIPQPTTQRCLQPL